MELAESVNGANSAESVVTEVKKEHSPNFDLKGYLDEYTSKMENKIVQIIEGRQKAKMTAKTLEEENLMLKSELEKLRQESQNIEKKVSRRYQVNSLLKEKGAHDIDAVLKLYPEILDKEDDDAVSEYMKEVEAKSGYLFAQQNSNQPSKPTVAKNPMTSSTPTDGVVSDTKYNEYKRLGFSDAAIKKTLSKKFDVLKK